MANPATAVSAVAGSILGRLARVADLKAAVADGMRPFERGRFSRAVSPGPFGGALENAWEPHRRGRPQLWARSIAPSRLFGKREPRCPGVLRNGPLRCPGRLFPRKSASNGGVDGPVPTVDGAGVDGALGRRRPGVKTPTAGAPVQAFDFGAVDRR